MELVEVSNVRIPRSIFDQTKTITRLALDHRRFYYPVLAAPIRSLLTFPGRLPSFMDSICKPQSVDNETNREGERGANLIAWKLRNWLVPVNDSFPQFLSTKSYITNVLDNIQFCNFDFFKKGWYKCYKLISDSSWNISDKNYIFK